MFWQGSVLSFEKPCEYAFELLIVRLLVKPKTVACLEVLFDLPVPPLVLLLWRDLHELLLAAGGLRVELLDRLGVDIEPKVLLVSNMTNEHELQDAIT